MKTSSGLALPWPVEVTKHVLEVAISLPTISWNAITNNPTIGATERSMQLPLTGNARFFRLRQPRVNRRRNAGFPAGSRLPRRGELHEFPFFW
jgi:hypothetical protein